MDEREFKERTRNLALRVIRLVGSLPKTPVAEVIGKQLLRSGTSVGANYRAACRARSRMDAISKLSIVEEEADESIYWVDLLVESGLVAKKNVEGLLKEMDEVLAMVVASIKTMRRNADNPRSRS